MSEEEEEADGKKNAMFIYHGNLKLIKTIQSTKRKDGLVSRMGMTVLNE